MAVFFEVAKIYSGPLRLYFDDALLEKEKTTIKDSQRKTGGKVEADSSPLYLRGYCRICNRHYFYRHQLDTKHTQVYQHHGGVCQKRRYPCARIQSPIRA